MAHNPSQPGAPPQGMPHQLAPHMAVSAPGGQMNPGPLVGGMPPGAGGPNAHAMSHLNPAQAQMFQAQHNNMGAFAANNQAMQQIQQQQRLQQLQQQQHTRQLMQQAYAQGGMAGMPMGVGINMNLLSPAAQQQAAQLAAMRARQQNPQAHQAMIAQQLALQQQQVAANNPMAQQGGNPNHPQLNQQQLQGFQQAQLQAVQMQQLQMQAQAQAQHHQMQAQAQAQQQAQAQAQGQGAHQQPNQQQQQPGQPPQQNQQQQQGPNGPGGNLQGQNQGQIQGSGPQGHQQPQHHQGQQQQQQLQQQQQQGPSQAQQQAHQAQLQAAQQSAIAHNMANQQALRQMRDLKGQCTLKLLSFAEHLNGFPGSKGKDDTQYWDNFVRMFFAENGVFRYTLPNTDENEQSEKSYDITFHALPRFFHTQFDSGVKNIQLVMDKTTELQPNNGRHVIENSKASMVYWFEGGSHIVATGTLRATFDPQQKMDLLEFITSSHEEYISRKLVIEAAKPAHNWVKDWHKVNTQNDGKQSPEMSKKGKARLMKSPQAPPPDLDLPHSAVKQNVGVTEAVYQFLEMVDIMGQMGPLFQYYHAHPGMAPYSALEQYVNQINTPAQQNMNMNMAMNMNMNMNMANGQPPMQQGGPRTPSFGQFQMGQSPAQAHQMLPASPHIGSPAPGQMQAPSMQLQASQQGTSSSGPSANTSPAQNNKRRRPSGVKNEEDGPGSAPTPATAGTPQINGVQGKTKPPTPRMPKRVKGNPA